MMSWLTSKFNHTTYTSELVPKQKLIVFSSRKTSGIRNVCVYSKVYGKALYLRPIKLHTNQAFKMTIKRGIELAQFA